MSIDSFPVHREAGGETVTSRVVLQLAPLSASPGEGGAVRHRTGHRAPQSSETNPLTVSPCPAHLEGLTDAQWALEQGGGGRPSPRRPEIRV